MANFKQKKYLNRGEIVRDCCERAKGIIHKNREDAWVELVTKMVSEGKVQELLIALDLMEQIHKGHDFEKISKEFKALELEYVIEASILGIVLEHSKQGPDFVSWNRPELLKFTAFKNTIKDWRNKHFDWAKQNNEPISEYQPEVQ